MTKEAAIAVGAGNGAETAVDLSATIGTTRGLDTATTRATTRDGVLITEAREPSSTCAGPLEPATPRANTTPTTRPIRPRPRIRDELDEILVIMIPPAVVADW